VSSQSKEPPTPPSTENFPKRPSVNLKPIIKKIQGIPERQKPVILIKQPIQQVNPPLLTEIKDKSTITNSGIPSQTPRIIKSKKEQENQKENILLAKIKKLEAENNNLRAVVQSEKQNNQLLKKTIANLTHKIQVDQQNHANLINAYQKVFNDKGRAELFAEKQRADNYQQQLKTIAKSLYQ